MKIQVGLLAILVGLSVRAEAASVVLHEWGTFTSLQDENGAAIGGINTDDEPVPEFVHRMARLLLLTPSEVPPSFFQGAPHCHPHVTMRLETPVIYFHPGGPEAGLPPMDVRVKFRGGWLTEFFPKADVQTPGLQSNRFAFGPLSSDTVSELSWKGVTFGGEGKGPATTDHVWLAPRAVKAVAVQTPEGEAEKFLFYRGVGNIAAPLRVSREEAGKVLAIRSQWQGTKRPLAQTHSPSDGESENRREVQIASLWLTEIQTDGRVAFRNLNPISLNQETNQVLAKTTASFEEKDFSRQNMARLRSGLQEALMKDGLFEDEAQALLNTWELSYFKSAGLRLFFLVPREWTDYYLPLETSPASEIRRVMVGRIELVTPRQRALLKKLAAQSRKTIAAEWKHLQANYYGRLPTTASPESASRTIQAVNRGQSRLASLGFTIPAGYQAYLELGRFRNALLLEEESRRPTEGLKAFIDSHALQGYRPRPELISGE